MCNPKDILKYYLLGLLTIIVFLSILVIIGDQDRNNKPDINHEPEPISKDKEIEQPAKLIPEFEITGIEVLDYCRIHVKTSLDGVFPERRSVMISVFGINGPYQSFGYFKANTITNYNIWAVFENDTVPYRRNGEPFIGKGCK